MLRFVSRWLALLALLLAPLPAAATAPAPPAVVAEAGHCEQADVASSQDDRTTPEQGEEHPCCKNSMGSCCPLAAPLAGPRTPARAEDVRSGFRSRPESFVRGTSGPPLTEPPTFA